MTTVQSADEARGEHRAAAEWWAEQLTRPPAMDNGDGFQSDFGTASAARAFAAPPTEQVKVFKEAIILEIEGHQRSILACDYHPDVALARAYKIAFGREPSMLTFPWKTTMWIEDGVVTVRKGRGADIDTIYESRRDAK